MSEIYTTDLIYEDSFMTVFNYEGWSIVSHLDSVVCLPYILDSNKVLLRKEFVPSFKSRDGKSEHLVCIGGGIEKGETPKKALERELLEEGGIILNKEIDLNHIEPIFYLKSLTTKFYPIVLRLYEKDFNRVEIKGDGSSIDNLSDLVELDLNWLLENLPPDLVTQFMLMKLKNLLNL